MREVAEDAIAFAEELGELTIVHPEAQQWEHQRDEHRDHDAHPLALGATPLHQCHDPTEEEEQERDHHDHEEHHPYVPLEVDAHAPGFHDLHKDIETQGNGHGNEDVAQWSASITGAQRGYHQHEERVRQRDGKQA